MPEHTAGPWWLEGSPDGMRVRSDKTYETAEDIALVYDLSIGGEEDNARLIAAAPELLAALELVMDRHTNGPDMDDYDYNIVVAAIAKARGGVQ